MKIGFITDIHEDLHSLEKSLRLLSSEKCDSVICLGDIVGFALPFYKYIETRNAEECVRLVKENCAAAVVGNHDLYAIKKIPQYKAGFDYGSNWYQLDYEIRSRKARNKIWLYEDNEILCKLSDNAKEYLSGLNEVEFLDLDNIRFMISHFCYPDFSGSAIFSPSEVFHLEKHFAFMNDNNTKISFSGHGHPEGIIVVTEEKFCNHEFDSNILLNFTQWIVVPCVARTTRINGVLVLDTSSKLFYAISLK
ncbi:MAG: metallophosphoesterase [Ignavibacteria bacterium]|nr:metallophosphoesterase [Ignavibacteria bacterium]